MHRLAGWIWEEWRVFCYSIYTAKRWNYGMGYYMQEHFGVDMARAALVWITSTTFFYLTSGQEGGNMGLS